MRALLILLSLAVCSFAGYAPRAGGGIDQANVNITGGTIGSNTDIYFGNNYRLANSGTPNPWLTFNNGNELYYDSNVFSMRMGFESVFATGTFGITTTGTFNGVWLGGGAGNPFSSVTSQTGRLYFDSGDNKLFYKSADGSGSGGWVELGGYVSNYSDSNKIWTDGTHVYWHTPGGVDLQLDN